MKKFPLYFLLLLVLSCQSCQLFDKDGDTLDPQQELAKLPPVTATGENTFGCLVNGKAFLPVQGFLGANALDGYVNLDNNLYLTASNIELDYKLTIIIQNIEEFSGDLTKSTTNIKTGAGDRISFTANGTVTREIVSGNLELIEEVIEQNIIAGTFNITFKKEDGSLIEITEGRFDFKY
ncbi:hypothetical protein [Marivirga sp.]|uniref:hypothetical protein n=1 Tax=Marivirga sp. TaxID=2018662 RepID=UPI002D7E7FCD|nr:hypothetical protein [Marivirga sp.]HET8858896.1 hypothetical protein [Marivirga sp.]